jgi:transposase-like protein
METPNTPDTLRDAIVHFDDFENCRRFMVLLRWPDGNVKCPRCGSDNIFWIAKERVWKCYGKHALAKFSLKTGTIFEDSPIALQKWLPAAWLVINCKNGVSSCEIARDLGVTQKTAWFMLHRVRLAMKSGTFEKFSGEVEADESFFGGKLANMHKHRQEKLRAEGRSRGGVFGKAIVSGLLDRHTKQARVKVVPNVRQFGLRTNIAENVEKGSTIYSDALKSYRNLGADGFVHEFIDHTEKYVEGRVHTNGLENFWSLFKRALKGTYVSVEPFHLQAYADEQCFRYNNCKLTDPERFAIVMQQIVGRRITYKQLIGKADESSSSETRPE